MRKTTKYRPISRLSACFAEFLHKIRLFSDENPGKKLAYRPIIGTFGAKIGENRCSRIFEVKIKEKFWPKILLVGRFFLQKI